MKRFTLSRSKLATHPVVLVRLWFWRNPPTDVSFDHSTTERGNIWLRYRCPNWPFPLSASERVLLCSCLELGEEGDRRGLEVGRFWIHWRSCSTCSLSTFYRLVHVWLLEQFFFVPKIQSFSTFLSCLVHFLDVWFPLNLRISSLFCFVWLFKHVSAISCCNKRKWKRLPMTSYICCSGNNGW